MYLLCIVHCAFCINKVAPLEGEGLWAFYIRNGLDTKELREEFYAINQGKFSKDGGLLTGVYYKIPEKCEVKETINESVPQPKVVDKKKLTKVTPLDGEGLWAFYNRVGLNTRGLRDQFAEINSGRFDKNGGLLTGVYYHLPDSSLYVADEAKKEVKKKQQKDEVTEPLLGSTYEKVMITSHELDSCVFYLVSGHGGPDPGAIGTVGLHEMHEDEYAYDVILRLGRQLMMCGATVHFIIQDEKDGIRDDAFLIGSKSETCRGKKIPLDQLSRLKQRCEAINSLSKSCKSKYQRAVFIHLDSRSTDKRIDVFFYHKKSNAKGKSLAKNVQKVFKKKYDTHQPTRGYEGTVASRDLYVLNNTNVPSLFLELGNIQNSQDQQRFIKKDNREALARWLCQGIIKDATE